MATPTEPENCAAFLKVLLSGVLPAVATIAAVLLPVFLGYRNYLKQRENELVRKRYLDEGLDLLIGKLEQALGVYRHNWALSLSLLKQYRDLDKGLDDKALSGFLTVDPTGMNITGAHRLRLLLNDNAGWDRIQETFAFVHNANAFFQHELACQLINGTLPLGVTKHEAVKRYRDRITALDQESERHYEFLSRLLDLATIVEREKFTFNSIAQFHHRKDVTAILAAIRTPATTK